MESVQCVVDPKKVDEEFIKKAFLQEAIAKRKEFNEDMREVYGSEVWGHFDNIPCERATIWIDPLDGTNEFVQGHLSSVTVLIGLTVDGVPKAGVVHHPFRSDEDDG